MMTLPIEQPPLTLASFTSEIAQAASKKRPINDPMVIEEIDLPTHKKIKQPDITNVCAETPGFELEKRIQNSLPYCTFRKPFPNSDLTILSKKKDSPGEGARNVALLRGIQKNHCYAFQFCTINPNNLKEPYRSFGTTATIEDVFRQLVTIPAQQRALYEYLALHGGTFLAADIEWYHKIGKGAKPTLNTILQLEEATLKTLRTAIEMVLGPLQNYKGREQNTTNSRVVCVGGHETDFIKISIHYKHSGIGFGPILYQKSTWQEIIEQGTQAQLKGFRSDHPQEGGKWLKNYPFIDTHMYKRGGEMRSAYSVNLAKQNPTPLTSRKYPEFTKVNFISHAIGIHYLQDREKTFSESGLERKEFDERLPEKHNINFIDTTKWDAKHNSTDLGTPKLPQNSMNRLGQQSSNTNKSSSTNKSVNVPLNIQELLGYRSADTSTSTPLYQWIEKNFQDTNKGFGIRPLTQKGKGKDRIYYINLIKPASTNCMTCPQGVVHDHNNLCVNITGTPKKKFQPVQGINQKNRTKEDADYYCKQYSASCYCFGCKTNEPWGYVPRAVVQQLGLPDLIELQREEKEQNSVWLQKIQDFTE